MPGQTCSFIHKHLVVFNERPLLAQSCRSRTYPLLECRMAMLHRGAEVAFSHFSEVAALMREVRCLGKSGR